MSLHRIHPIAAALPLKEAVLPNEVDDQVGELDAFAGGLIAESEVAPAAMVEVGVIAAPGTALKAEGGTGQVHPEAAHLHTPPFHRRPRQGPAGPRRLQDSLQGAGDLFVRDPETS